MSRTPGKPYSTYLKLVLFAGAVLAAILHYVFVGQELYVQESTLVGYTAWFDLDREKNVPTAYNSLLLLMTAGVSLLLRTRSRNKLQRVTWAGVALIFAYLAADEFMIIHEQLALPLRQLLSIGDTSPFFHAWVVPALVGGCLLGVYAAIMTIRLKRNDRGLGRVHTSRSVLYAFVLLVISVSLIEMIGTAVFANQTLYRLFVIPMEELTEIGIISFILHRIYRDAIS